LTYIPIIFENLIFNILCVLTLPLLSLILLHY